VEYENNNNIHDKRNENLGIVNKLDNVDAWSEKDSAVKKNRSVLRGMFG
jgi:hypothetical protein